jgi:hypothetical protein
MTALLTSQIVTAIKTGSFDNLQLLAIEIAVDEKRAEINTTPALSPHVLGALRGTA